MYSLFFVICPWELKPMITYWRWSQWSMVESGAPICASAHACEFVCALIPLLNVGELWEWCPWFVIFQVRMYVLPVSAVVFVGMQQANHSIVGHLSSVIDAESLHISLCERLMACSLSPCLFSHHASTYESWAIFRFFLPDSPEHLHIKGGMGEGFRNSHHWCDAFWDTLNMTRITLIFQNITCDYSPCRNIRGKKPLTVTGAKAQK